MKRRPAPIKLCDLPWQERAARVLEVALAEGAAAAREEVATLERTDRNLIFLDLLGEMRSRGGEPTYGELLRLVGDEPSTAKQGG